jgi:SAM-dependent methyltransferase
VIKKISIIIKNYVNKILYFIFKYKIYKKYLNGIVAEVGAGQNPFYKTKSTIYFDKYVEDKSPKKTIRCDASYLPVDNNYFDSLLSAHCLEHCPNTLLVLKEWNRVIKFQGILILILPHGKRTFDKERKFANLQQHIEDYNNKISYNDKTHLQDFINISLYNCNDAWIKNAKDNNGNVNIDFLISNGLVHYHVWSPKEMIEIVEYAGFEIIECRDKVIGRDDSFLIIAKKKRI